MSESSQWASEGGGAQDLYLAQRLEYRDHRTEGDAGLSQSAFRRIFLLWLGITVVAVLIGLLAHLTIYEDNLSKSNVVASVAWWALASIPRRTWASHWQFLVENAAYAEDRAYDTIVAAAENRRLPIETGTRRILRPSRPARRYLVMHEGFLVAYVGVAAYGTGLFVSWSLWREQSLLSMLWSRLVLFFYWVIGRDTLLGEHLSVDDARAMREAVHNVAREGVELAMLAAKAPAGPTPGATA